MKKLIPILIAALMLLIPAEFSAAGGVSVDKIEFRDPDFIRGMDVSSVISLENAGVSFRNSDGQTEDIFRILSDSGVNYIRVRVWNDPFDGGKNGYGGGNNDLQTAKLIGSRAAKYKMKLCVDFHYSDFWADPAKQKAPKSWEGLSVEEKKTALKRYTLSSLKELKASGADIGMVQIGNETTGGIAGEYRRSDMAQLFSAGSEAVREFDGKVLVALHFTNPERTSAMKELADFLDSCKVDYDVFATSYYPYWHGSLSNLKEVLGYVSGKYGKYVLVAETSYANTLTDSDGHPNTVTQTANSSGVDLIWSFDEQGQADELRAIMNAVNDVKNGLGVFYWEGAWITVGDTSSLWGGALSDRLQKNRALWEKFGCGWAASFSSEYDPDDAGKYYGGSAVDNQAFFAPDGRALDSLNVFKYVLTGTYLSGDADGDGRVSISDATEIQRIIAKISGENSAADADGDGAVTVSDVTLIQKYLAKYDVPYTVNVYKAK